MVVGLALAAVQMGMALPTGFLFGVGYGTGVRIGYEQVYPLLFPKGARPTTTELAATMKGMNTVYDAIGGKDASRMGIAVGITNAGEILKHPDFQVLEKLESSSSGPTSSSSSRLDSGRGALDRSVNSPEENVAEEIASFNELTNAEIWTKVRAMSTGQILNSRTGQGMSQVWMEITGKVLAERTLLPEQTSETPSYDSGFTSYTPPTTTTISSRITIKIWAGTPNSLTYNGYGQVLKYLTTLIRKTNRASRVLSLTQKGKATRGDKIPRATKITFWSALITGNKALQNNQTIFFSIPRGY